MLHLGNLNLGGRVWRGGQAGTQSQQPCVHVFSHMPEILSEKKQNGAGRGLGTETELSLDQGEHTKRPKS